MFCFCFGYALQWQLIPNGDPVALNPFTLLYTPLLVFSLQSLLGEIKNMAADDDGMVFEETNEFTNSEEHFLPPGWEIRTMDDGRIYYAK